MPRFALWMSYDGSAFSGWWRVHGQRSVASELDAAFARLGENNAAPVGASRTDAGVHARGQAAHVDVERPWTPTALLRALASQLPGDCSCIAVAAVDDAWHAVHHATGKTYSYTIDNGEIANPFTARTAWRPPFRLSLETLTHLSALIPGERDWSAFARRGDFRSDHHRRISAMTWHAHHESLICTVAGTGFTYRLVRSLVGAVVATAHGTCTSDDLTRALHGEPTAAARQQAPAHGLCLEQVEYAQTVDWTRY